MSNYTLFSIFLDMEDSSQPAGHSGIMGKLPFERMPDALAIRTLS